MLPLFSCRKTTETKEGLRLPPVRPYLGYGLSVYIADSYVFPPVMTTTVTNAETGRIACGLHCNLCGGVRFGRGWNVRQNGMLLSLACNHVRFARWQV